MRENLEMMLMLSRLMFAKARKSADSIIQKKAGINNIHNQGVT